MQWEFTPEQVVKAEVDYTLENFRHDLRQEVEQNLPGTDDGAIDRVFRLLYDLCYWLATGKDYQEFEDSIDSPSTKMFLQSAKVHQQANVEMLGAILQRSIMDGVEAGMSVDDAVAHAASRHQQQTAVH
ncbi:hypothetical protein [Thiothrix winogradskyi]|uniref:Uncharacterized protein n=1 Tax=Thiothrix winogradskyi TaxID=96472 RepID=A0ABY3T4H4_9GAMM|nr:hypothetical protein [Thiothrix winogradskyi]UJS26328.1 hypothetical protein L2Y54_09890 [Thiothrix winogradskyi]